MSPRMSSRLLAAFVGWTVVFSSASVPAAETPTTAPAKPAAPAADPVVPELPKDLPEKPELVTDRYPDGKVKVQREVARDKQGNYVNHGQFTMYDLQGKVLRTGTYRLAKQHGKWTRYFRACDGELFCGELAGQFTGPFVSEAEFLDGLLHGIWTIQDSVQRKTIQWEFEGGQRHGKAVWYYPNGEKRREATFDHGEPTGELIEWGPDKKLVSRATFLHGRVLRPIVQFYEPGRKRYEGFHLSADNASRATFDWWNGTVSTSDNPKADKDLKHGAWVAYYRNGQKTVEGEYREDQPHGKFTWWYESGQKQAEGSYQNGREHGVWHTWHSNGMRESRQEFDRGVLTGTKVRWTSEGQLVEVRHIGQGPPQSADKPVRLPKVSKS